MVWPRFKVFWFSKDNSTGQSESTKKKRQTEEEVDNVKEWTGMDCASSTRAAETTQDGKGLFRTHLWCPDDLPRLWDKIE